MNSTKFSYLGDQGVICTETKALRKSDTVCTPTALLCKIQVFQGPEGRLYLKKNTLRSFETSTICQLIRRKPPKKTFGFGVKLCSALSA